MSTSIQYDRDAISAALLASLGTVYDCTRSWSAWSYGTMGPEDFTPFDQQDDRVEEVVDAIVAALPRPPEQVKCDGNHGGPRCADPECWNDSPPASDPLKDNQIAALINKVCRLAREFHNHDSLRQRIAQELVPALKATPERHLTVTTNRRGEAVMVSWQDDEHRILEVVWERNPDTPEPVGEPVAWLYAEDGETKFGHPQGHHPKDARPLVFGDTHPAPGVPEGFALVPVEPTPEMKAAGIKVEVYSEASDSIGALTWAEVAAIYRSMLAAAQAKGGE